MYSAGSVGKQRDSWSSRRAKKGARLGRIAHLMKGHVLATGDIVEALQTLIEPSDKVVLEGDNQKQADFLSRALVQADPKKLHDLHLLISSVSRPEHLTLFERGNFKDSSAVHSRFITAANLISSQPPEMSTAVSQTRGSTSGLHFSLIPRFRDVAKRVSVYWCCNNLRG